MKVLVFTLCSLLCGIHAWSAIPSIQTILDRTVKNSGNGVYAIEQEVQFPNGQGLLILRESWVIAGPNQMQLTVRGTQELKDSIFAQFNYDASNTGPGDFVEKYFHFRDPKALTQELLRLGVISQASLIRKPIRNLKDHVHSPQPDIRLARVGGVINYAIGIPADSNSNRTLPPGLWIEQDQFVIRKLRTNTGAEIFAEKYSVNSRGLHFPQSRTLRWEGQEVQIQTISVTPKPKSFFGKQQKAEPRWDGLENLPAKNIVDSFYSRFR